MPQNARRSHTSACRTLIETYCHYNQVDISHYQLLGKYRAYLSAAIASAFRPMISDNLANTHEVAEVISLRRALIDYNFYQLFIFTFI